MKTKEIYLVRELEDDSIDNICAMFDSRSAAEAFIKRFKTTDHFEIIEQAINPDYFSDPGRDPYRVVLEKTDNNPFDISICDLNLDAEEARQEQYRFTFFEMNGLLTGRFQIMLLAASEAEAIARAVELRDGTISSGEWNLEFNKAQQQSLILNPDEV